ncbi:MAG: hypothetical protein D6677_03440 [Calditrichaeota bacterium]|nr:MAG: hypothetical protein D6677_03440 [Calditrichota bacterium]
MMLRVLSYIYIVGIGILLFGGKIQGAELRRFPELYGHSFGKLVKVSENHFFAYADDRKLYEWKGKNWQLFNDQLPVKHKINQFFVRSAKNIWTITEKRSDYYKSDIWHYNGQDWRKIDVPLSSQINRMAFLNAHSFFTGGLWGSFAFFDGNQLHKIETPAFSSLGYLKAVSPTECYAVLLKERIEKNLYHYKEGKWRKIMKIPKSLKILKVFNTDSALVYYLPEKRMGMLRYKRFVPFKNGAPGNLKFTYSDKAVYYVRHDSLFKFERDNETYCNPGIPHSRVYPINENEFFFERYGEIYYYGPRKIGVSLTARHKLFEGLQVQGRQHNSISMYRNRQGHYEMYMASFNHKNYFYKFDKIELKDISNQRHLIGSPANMNDFWDSGVTFADLDNDGDADALLASLRGKCKLFENRGDDYFEEITDLAGFKLSGRINEIHTADLNNDGWLDLIAGDELGRLYIQKNEGFFRFTQLDSIPGLENLKDGVSTALADMNNDGRPDLFVYSIFHPLRYFENISTRDTIRFADRSASLPESIHSAHYFTQSLSFNDYDHDGFTDFVMVNRNNPTKLFKNIDGRHFVDVSATTGFNKRWLAYSAAWGDIDQDGWDDVVVANLGRNYILWNNEGLTFEPDSLTLPDNKVSYTVSAVLEDIDDDRDLDLILVNNYFGNCQILTNSVNTHSAIQINVTDALNRPVLGAHVYLYHTDDTIPTLAGHQEIRNHNGYNANIWPRAFFSVHANSLYKAVIHLPNGAQISLDSIKTGQRLAVVYDYPLVYQYLQKLNTEIQRAFLHPRLKGGTLNYLLLVFIIGVVFFFSSRYGLWQFVHKVVFALAMSLFFILINRIWPAYYPAKLFYIHFFSTLGLGISLFFIFNIYVQKIYLEGVNDHLSELLSRFGHSRGGMNNIDHLMFLLNNRSDDVRKLREEWALFERSTLKRLEEIGRMAVNLFPNEKSVHSLQKIAARIGKTDVNHPRGRAALKQALADMKQNVQHIRHLFDLNYNIELNQALNKALSAFPEFTAIRVLNNTSRYKIYVVIGETDFFMVMENLLQNALDAGSGEIVLTMDEGIGNYYTLHVQDFGKGIPEALRENIFIEGFSGKGSSGLGLAHCAAVLKKWGGHIRLANAHPEEGTVFEVTLRKGHHENPGHDR